ncbi:MAG: dinitrogenase iron-molybdenum cofactor biosynthesis protein [Clostridia bacterium]|nr:dinitrogenase iron-molybdenum cofactor biosynthesis protein [Clostridia bacterium]
MKIAVTYDGGKIFQHFGHTEKFKIYEINEGEIVKMEVVDTKGNGHGALATFLSEEGVEVVICGGIGGGAKTALSEAGIKLFGGVKGSADNAVIAFLTNKLEYDPDVACSHHGEGHSCSDHDCHSH